MATHRVVDKTVSFGLVYSTDLSTAMVLDRSGMPPDRPAPKEIVLKKRYRKVHCTIWNEERFARVSNNAKLAYFYILTHPNMTALGAMRGTASGIAAELGIPTSAVNELLNCHIVQYDPSSACLYIPDFIGWQTPESTNVVKAWAKSFDLIPDGIFKRQVVLEAHAFIKTLSMPFQVAFEKALKEAFPHGLDVGITEDKPLVFRVA